MRLECTAFLQWCLPRLRLRWAGFRKVRQQVCKRLSRRMNELGLSNLSEYQDYLKEHPVEWRVLDSFCRITISRFYRDQAVFDALRSALLPSLAAQALSAGSSELRCWSAGCCSGEEAYTLRILWTTFVLPVLRQDLLLHIIATDADDALLARAQRGCYSKSSIMDLPGELVQQAFTRSGDLYTIKKTFTENMTFVQQDIREQLPDGPFQLILCRNFVFTYFTEALQREILDKIIARLAPGGILVIGCHEAIPQGMTTLVPCGRSRGMYKKAECQ